MLFTDGITEVRRYFQNKKNEEYGMKNLENIIQANTHLPAEELRDTILTDVISFAGTHSFRDDTTLIVIEFK